MTRICPICGREYAEYPALSRKDNTTEICPNCGVKEAFEDFFDNLHGGGEMTLFEKAYFKGVPVREKKTGIVAKVIDAFGDGELYLDEGTSGISPVSAYDENDFEELR